jgi:hypothetical protein
MEKPMNKLNHTTLKVSISLAALTFIANIGNINAMERQLFAYKGIVRKYNNQERQETRENVVKIVDLNKTEKELVKTLYCNPIDMKFSNFDESILFTISKDAIDVWDVDKEDKQENIIHFDFGGIKILPSKVNKNIFITAHDYGTINVFDFSKEQALIKTVRLTETAKSMALNSENILIVGCSKYSGSSQINIIDLSADTGKEIIKTINLFENTTSDNQRDYIWALSFNKFNQNIFVSSHTNGCINIWDIREIREPKIIKTINEFSSGGRSVMNLALSNVMEDDSLLCLLQQEIQLFPTLKHNFGWTILNKYDLERKMVKAIELSPANKDIIAYTAESHNGDENEIVVFSINSENSNKKRIFSDNVFRPRQNAGPIAFSQITETKRQKQFRTEFTKTLKPLERHPGHHDFGKKTKVPFSDTRFHLLAEQPEQNNI